MTVFASKTIIDKVSKELMLGYRLMVGRQILVLDVEVRILVPEPIPFSILLRNHEYLP